MHIAPLAPILRAYREPPEVEFPDPEPITRYPDHVRISDPAPVQVPACPHEVSAKFRRVPTGANGRCKRWSMR